MSATATAPTDDCIHAGVSAKHRSVFVLSAAYFEIRPWWWSYAKLTLPGCVLYADGPMGDPSCFPSDLPDRLRELQRLKQAMDTTPGGWNPKGPVRQAHHDYELALFMELMGTPLRRSRRLAGKAPAPATLPAWGARSDILHKRRKNATAEEIGRKVNTLYPGWSKIGPMPHVIREFERLLTTAHAVIQRLLSGNNGSFRTLTKEEALEWKYNPYNYCVLTGVICNWMAEYNRGDYGWRANPRCWDEEQVEIALRQHTYLWSLVTGK